MRYHVPRCPSVRAGAALTPALLLLVVGQASAQSAFTAAGTYNTGTLPVAIVAAEFNSDGRTDLATANQTSQNVSIFLFGAAGTPTISTVALGQTPTGIYAGELSCTTGMDIALATSTSTIKFLRNNGAGVFTLQPDNNNIALGSSGVVIMDFNGDGMPSIVGTTSDTGVPGTFALASRSGQGTGDGCGGYSGQDTMQTVGNTPLALALGSFNTVAGGIRAPDNFPDIAVVNNGAGTIDIMLYDGEAPQTGAPGGILTVKSATIDLGSTSDPRAIVTGQFNPTIDSRTDLAVVCFGDRTVRLFFGTGLGTFAAGPIYKVAPGPVAMAVGDLTGDGIPDLAVVSTAALPVGVSPSFTGVGMLAGGATPSSSVLGLSGDGTIAVGQSSSTSGPQAFRWTLAGGIAGLSDLAGSTFASSAGGASFDGSVVAGWGTSTASGTSTEAFRWTQAGLVALGDLLPNPDFTSTANAISSNGSVLAGTGRPGTDNQALRWTQATGLVSLGSLPDIHRAESYANGISADGAVIVGEAASVISGTELEAFRWTPVTGMIGIGDLPGGPFSSRALAVSADGTTVVGWSATDTAPLGARNDPYRWTQDEGMVSLGVFSPGGSLGGKAWGVNEDGAVIVGQCNIAAPINGDAFRWTTAEGSMKKVRDLLVGAGVGNLSTWVLKEARAVSADGTVLAGSGTNPSGRTEGWVARLPVPPVVTVLASNGQGVFTRRAVIAVGRTPTAVAIGQFAGNSQLDLAVTSGQDNQVTIYRNNACPGDYDANGSVQPADIAAFIAAWLASLQNGTLAADFDHNGLIQPADISLFVNVWFASLSGGC